MILIGYVCDRHYITKGVNSQMKQLICQFRDILTQVNDFEFKLIGIGYMKSEHCCIRTICVL